MNNPRVPRTSTPGSEDDCEIRQYAGGPLNGPFTLIAQLSAQAEWENCSNIMNMKTLPVVGMVFGFDQGKRPRPLVSLRAQTGQVVAP